MANHKSTGLCNRICLRASHYELSCRGLDSDRQHRADRAVLTISFYVDSDAGPVVGQDLPQEWPYLLKDHSYYRDFLENAQNRYRRPGQSSSPRKTSLCGLSVAILTVSRS